MWCDCDYVDNILRHNLSLDMAAEIFLTVMLSPQAVFYRKRFVLGLTVNICRECRELYRQLQENNQSDYYMNVRTPYHDELLRRLEAMTDDGVDFSDMPELMTSATVSL